MPEPVIIAECSQCPYGRWGRNGRNDVVWICSPPEGECPKVADRYFVSPPEVEPPILDGEWDK